MARLPLWDRDSKRSTNGRSGLGRASSSALVPRGLAVFGLIGGPLVILAGTAVIFDLIEAGGPVQGLLTIPEAFWELSIGIYLIARGFKPTSAVLAGTRDAPLS
jgi:hypothetical protein